MPPDFHLMQNADLFYSFRPLRVDFFRSGYDDSRPEADIAFYY
jgi:hypothetical protein